MGLDICLQKVTIEKQDEQYDIEYHKDLEEMFKDKIQTVTNSYFAVEKRYKELGYDMKDIIWCGTFWTDDAMIETVNIKNDPNHIKYMFYKERYIGRKRSKKKRLAKKFKKAYRYYSDLANIEIRTSETFDQDDKVLYSKEIGYQRKGFNAAGYAFLNDLCEKDLSDCFTLYKDVLYHYENYVADDRKEDFKKDILDKFVEGETFLYYSF